MSEELNKPQKFENEKYKYVPEDGVELIVDKPSEPLKIKKSKKVSDKEESIELEIDSNVLIIETTTLGPQKFINKDFSKKEIKSNKELYEFYIKDLKNFSLILNGEVIYDSSIDKFKEYPVKFENDFFILYGRKYSYNGLKIQKINIR